MIELKVVTPFNLLNYADFLFANNYFEEGFKAYETGLTLFTWPGLYDIWLIYLTKFVERYKGEKLERGRDLFEKVIETCPKDVKPPFVSGYLKYQ